MGDRQVGVKVRKVKADLLVDGEVFGGAAVFWGQVAHRCVTKRLQRTRDIEFFVDHLRRHRHASYTHLRMERSYLVHLLLLIKLQYFWLEQLIFVLFCCKIISIACCKCCWYDVDTRFNPVITVHKQSQAFVLMLTSGVLL